MCKILCLTKHDPKKRDEIIARVWADMKLTERDGYGAAWFSASGEIGYYKSRWPVIPTEKVPEFVKPAFYDFNDVESDGGYLIIHGRAASSTCPINVHNTHPMLAEDGTMALIHNGFVNSFRYKNVLPCSCDSELLLLAYKDNGITAVSRYIAGSYAFMALEYKDDKKTLHIAKNAHKDLYVGKLGDGSYAIGTALHLLDEVGAIPLGEFQDNHTVIFGRVDKDLEITKFEPYKYAQTSYADYEDERYTGYVAPFGPDKSKTDVKNVQTELIDDTPSDDSSLEDEIARQEREPIEIQ